jgi:DNA-binding NarL/FixJ family response regulator
MGKTYILGNNNAIAEHLGFSFKEIPTITNSNDYEIHNWVISLFQQDNINKLVVEIGDDVVLSLKIAYHIRLSLNELRRSSLIPVFFISTSTLNSIILKAGVWSHILTTKGVYFSTINSIEEIKLELSVIEGIASDEYISQFWDIVKMLPGEVMGRHSLANIWGAYSMDRAANINILRSNPDFKRRSTELYFKYVSAPNNLEMLNIKTVGHINVGSPNLINAENKKILLIDDEAEKGWETVLRSVFKTTSADDFVVINEKVKDYNNFSIEHKSLIESTPFDLYLIDLRLGGIEEDGILNPDDFSGMKVLHKIKLLNPGNQVIIFTASNKVWNLKALLDAGADGYYMKESPEFAFTKEFSEQNYQRFQQDVKRCFDRDFLKVLFSDLKSIKNHIPTFTDTDFKNELLNQLDLFWNMICKTNSETDFAYAYVTLYLIIEIVNNHFYQQTTNNKWNISGVGNLLDWQWDKNQNTYINTNQEITTTNPPEWQKTAGLFFQKWGQTDSSFIMKIYFFIQKRNGFMHNDKNILDKQNSQGQYLNRDIFTKEGILKLSSVIKQMIGYI